MEPITMAAIVGSLIFGMLVGFVTMTFGDMRIKAAVEAAGALTLTLFLFAIMPTVGWETPVSEAVQNTTDFMITAIYALVSYAIADTLGSAGYSLVTGMGC